MGSAYRADLLNSSIGGYCVGLSLRQVVPRLRNIGGTSRNGSIEGVGAWLAKRRVPRRIAERGQRGKK